MKIKVKVKPGQVLNLVDGTYKDGDELMMDEKDAEPILETCIERVWKKKEKKAEAPPADDESPKDEKETV